MFESRAKALISIYGLIKFLFDFQYYRNQALSLKFKSFHIKYRDQEFQINNIPKKIQLLKKTFIIFVTIRKLNRVDPGSIRFRCQLGCYFTKYCQLRETKSPCFSEHRVHCNVMYIYFVEFTSVYSYIYICMLYIKFLYNTLSFLKTKKTKYLVH